MIPSPAERDFLLQLLRFRPPADDFEERGASADWPRVMALLGPALHPWVSWSTTTRGIRLPAHAAEALAAKRRANAALTLQRRAVIRQVAETLHRAAIPFVFVKGFALAQRVYPAPDTRVMGDVDIWVGDRLVEAAAALETIGWRVPWWRRAHARFTVEGHEVGMRLGDTQHMLELHRAPRSLADTIPAELDEIWRRAAPADLGGISAATPALDDMLIHAVLHLAEHHLFLAAMPRLVDVACIARTGAIDWMAFAARCRLLGIAGWTATALETARRNVGAEIPEAAIAALGVPDLDHLVELASEQAWISERNGERPHAFAAADGLWAKTRLVADRARIIAFGIPGGTDKTRLSVGRLLRRVRFTLQFTLPTLVRTAWRGTYRGAEGAQLRSAGARNAALVDQMRRHSPGLTRYASSTQPQQ